MGKPYQFTIGDLYSYQVKAAQAFSDMLVPDVSSISEQSFQGNHFIDKKQHTSSMKQ